VNNTDFAVPVFHAYGHVLEWQVSCICLVSYSHFFFQNNFNPRNITGFGLSDGEGVERLCTYLRSCTSMTKKMHPSHHVDVLSDTLQHYRQKINRENRYVLELKYICFALLVWFHKKFTGNLLCKCMEHAIHFQSEATQALAALKEDPLCMYICV